MGYGIMMGLCAHLVFSMGLQRGIVIECDFQVEGAILFFEIAENHGRFRYVMAGLYKIGFDASSWMFMVFRGTPIVGNLILDDMGR